MQNSIVRAVVCQALLVASLFAVGSAVFVFTEDGVVTLAVLLAVFGLVRLDDSLIRRRRERAALAAERLDVERVARG